MADKQAIAVHVACLSAVGPQGQALSRGGDIQSGRRQCRRGKRVPEKRHLGHTEFKVPEALAGGGGSRQLSSLKLGHVARPAVQMPELSAWRGLLTVPREDGLAGCVSIPVGTPVSAAHREGRVEMEEHRFLSETGVSSGSRIHYLLAVQGPRLGWVNVLVKPRI